MRDLDSRILVNLLRQKLTPPPRGSGRTEIPVAWASSRGTVREENQDRLVVGHGHTGLSIAIVADGMGGMKDGASAAAVAASAAAAYCIMTPLTSLQTLLAGALRFANEEVFRILRGEGGAAMVLAAWTSSSRYVAHAGDARAYYINDDGTLEQLTPDDTVKGQLQDLGRPAAQESPIHSQLLQFIGVGKELEPHVTHVPDGGRGLLLTSDGVHGLPLSVMEWVVKRAGNLQGVVERLVTASEWNGGYDNGTAVALSFRNGPQVVPDLTEFWFPGDHLVFLTGGVTPQVGEWPRTPQDYQSRSRTNRGRKQPKPRGTSDSKPEVSRDRPLPIVAFEDSPPRESNGADSPPSPAIPAVETEGSQSSPTVVPDNPLVPDKRGDEQ